MIAAGVTFAATLLILALLFFGVWLAVRFFDRR